MKIITTRKICNLYGVTRQRVQQWRNTGLPFYKTDKFYYYDADEVEEWIKKRRTQYKSWTNGYHKP